MSRRMSPGSVALEAQRPIPNRERMRNGHKPKASFDSAEVAARLKSQRGGSQTRPLLFSILSYLDGFAVALLVASRLAFRAACED